MTLVAQYIALVLLHNAERAPAEKLGGSPTRLAGQIRSKNQIAINQDDMAEAVALLEPFGAADGDYNPLTGGYWEIDYDNFRYYFIEDRPEKEDDEAQYAELSALAHEYPVLQAYARRGVGYAEDVISHLQALGSDGWDQLRAEALEPTRSEAPASDRIVKVTDNQRIEIDSAAEELSRSIIKENAIDGNSELRDRYLAQIAAGRELLRAQSVRAYLIYETFVRMLMALIEKYKGHAIGQVARKLLDLLVEHIVGK